MSGVYDHPEYLAQLAGIRAMPEDDVRRLVLADWLEERGEGERAEFIRIGVQIRRWGCSFKQTAEQPGWKHDCGTDDTGYWLCQPLRSRERELLAGSEGRWMEPSPTPSPVVFQPNNGEQYGWGLREKTRLGDEFVPVEFRRGFVHTVWCRLADWVGGPCPTCGGDGQTSYDVIPDSDGTCRPCRGSGRTPGFGPRVVATHPVEKVVVTDREPDPIGGGWCWIRNRDELIDAGACLPAVVFDRLQGGVKECGGEDWAAIIGHNDQWVIYDTPEDANDALSAACLRWAESQPSPPGVPCPICSNPACENPGGKH